MMVQLLSFAVSAALILLSIGSIAATARAEMPYIRRALGLQERRRPRRPQPERRVVRVVRQMEPRRPATSQRLCAAA